MTCELRWPAMDAQRVRAAIEAAIKQCSAQRPEYARAIVEPAEKNPDRASIHVLYPAELVQRPGWESQPPSEGPETDGTYPCTYEHYAVEAQPEYDEPAYCVVTLRSNKSANRLAWITASTVLERATELLGGTLQDF